MRKKILILLGTAGLILTGCTNLRELSVDQFRSQEFYRQTAQVNKNIQQIEELYGLDDEYRKSNQRITTQIHVSEDGKHASIWWQTSGLAQSSTMALMDCDEDPQGKTSKVTIYAADDQWGQYPQHMLNLMKMD